MTTVQTTSTYSKTSAHLIVVLPNLQVVSRTITHLLLHALPGLSYNFLDGILRHHIEDATLQPDPIPQRVHVYDVLVDGCMETLYHIISYQEVLPTN